MARYLEIKGDITNPVKRRKKDVIIIPHVCNNIGKFGAGVAKSIAYKWPNVKEEYLNKSLYKMGTTQFVFAEEGIFVANMIAQYRIKTFNNLKPIRYEALIKTMISVGDKWDEYQGLGYETFIHCPKFGSEHAGGNWNFIKELIQEIWVNQGIDVTVYLL